MQTSYLSLGSNLGEREESLERALAKLEGEGVTVSRRSGIYETEPQDVAEQPWFLNMVVEAATKLLPKQLLATVQRIEREMGRTRAGVMRGGPRVIDIDILLYGFVVMDTPQLTIPHARMIERRFVLQPLLEIAPELRHPVMKGLLKDYSVQVSGQKVRQISPR